MPEKQGRPRRYCSRGCQQKAYRARRAVPAIPAAMRDRARWLLWVPRERNGKTTKVPQTLFGQDADVTDPRSWSTFEKASAAAREGRIGFVLGDGIGCIDLDHCVSDGVVAPWASEVIKSRRSEALLVELSPSGTGVHIFLPLDEGPGRRVRDGEVQVEVYSRGRYMTVTGKQI